MQDVISANSSAQQNVNSTPMNIDQRQNDRVTNNNSLLFTATIFAAPNMSQASDQQVMAMQQNRQTNDSNSQALISDLNPFLTGSIDITHQVQSPTVEQLLTNSNEDDGKDNYKGKFSRVVQWKAQLPKREPHNYDKCQNTAHQTTMYNQILAQQQETTPATAAPIYNNNSYMTEVAAANINQMPSPILTTTNTYNSNCGAQNVLNLSNNQIYGNKMIMNQQVINKNFDHVFSVSRVLQNN